MFSPPSSRLVPPKSTWVYLTKWKQSNLARIWSAFHKNLNPFNVVENDLCLGGLGFVSLKGLHCAATMGGKAFHDLRLSMTFAGGAGVHRWDGYIFSPFFDSVRKSAHFGEQKP